MNWLKVLVGFSALIIAGCAAYFSVTGLGVLFAGASLAVMVMASSLEVAKLVAATYLKQKWNEIGGFNKWYLTISVGVLMLITSAGIFGYLSNAFQQQNLKLGQIDREISVYQTKITQNESEIIRFTTQLNNLQQIRNSQEQNISKVVERNGSTSRLTQMVKNADAEITKISQKINTLTEENNKNFEKINEIKNANIETEREVGGFRFVAEAFGLELNTVVKFFIFLIVIVFDPLAVALIIAFNGLVSDKKRKQKEILVEMMENDQKLGLYNENVKNDIADFEHKTLKELSDYFKNTPQEQIDKDIEEVEKIYQIYGDSGKNLSNSQEMGDILENNSKDEIQMPDLNWEAYMHPDFPWSDRQKWINNQKAVQYWMNNKNGTVRELNRIRLEEEAKTENVKTY
jgi:hypothetical protein